MLNHAFNTVKTITLPSHSPAAANKDTTTQFITTMVNALDNMTNIAERTKLLETIISANGTMSKNLDTLQHALIVLQCNQDGLTNISKTLFKFIINVYIPLITDTLNKVLSIVSTLLQDF